MGIVSKKTLYANIDIAKVEKDARADWDKERRHRQSLEKTIIGLLPFGIVVMSIIFFLLSAPHTQRLLEMITPTFAGFLSPLAWELGILIFSALREAGWKNKLTWSILTILLSMSIFINVSGSIISVVESSGAKLGTLTFQNIIDSFGGFSITYQIVLVLSIPVGAVIPIIAKLAGESVIKLALGKITLVSSDTEVTWQHDVQEIMYRALLRSAVREGATADVAGEWARVISSQMYGRQNRSEDTFTVAARTVGEAAAQSQPALSAMQQVFSPQANQRVKSSELEVWMNSNSQRIAQMSNRDVAKLYSKEVLGTESDNSYKSVERIRNK